MTTREERSAPETDSRISSAFVAAFRVDDKAALADAPTFFFDATMPIYVYEVIDPAKRDTERFEIQQSMAEAPLTAHPISGKAVRRVLQVPHLATKHTPGATKSRLENKRIEQAGFTKYERDKLTGAYHRVAGKNGPETFRRPD